MTTHSRRHGAWWGAGLVCALAVGVSPARAETVRDVRLKMGSRFELTAVHVDRAAAQAAIDAAYLEIDRIESVISSWRETSETSAVNRAAGSYPVAVSGELFELIRRALKVSVLTDGAFDLTFAGHWRSGDRGPPGGVAGGRRQLGHQ